MIELPDGLTLQRTTPTFDDEPDVPGNVRTVAAGDTQVIPPARPHHLVVDGPVTLAVEFHR